jgi:two-component system, OmpR family, KDP operon response regulator KdpE
MTDIPKPTLLLAENDSALRDLLVLAFSQVGWQVSCAADGAAALEMARSSQPNAMLLDILLPKINGLDILRALKKQAGFEQLPIIVMSELAFRETVEQAIGAGAQAFIVKPFTVQDVVDKVQQALQEPVRQARQAPPRPGRVPQVRDYRPPTYRKIVSNPATPG